MSATTRPRIRSAPSTRPGRCQASRAGSSIRPTKARESLGLKRSCRWVADRLGTAGPAIVAFPASGRARKVARAGPFTGRTPRCLMGMKSYRENGVLVLADISGFTEFVTGTELEHGPPIIAALLEEVMRHLAPPLEIQEVEGDAVFALGPDRAVVPPARLLAVLEDAFNGFRSLQREIQADQSCSCRVCRNVAVLDLKIVAHHGSFLRQFVGDRSQAAGADVILVHRLLKNRVAGTRAYVLLTAAALRWLELDAALAGLSAHTEHYEHLGEVQCFVRELESAEAGEPVYRAS